MNRETVLFREYLQNIAYIAKKNNNSAYVALQQTKELSEKLKY